MAKEIGRKTRKEAVEMTQIRKEREQRMQKVTNQDTNQVMQVDKDGNVPPQLEEGVEKLWKARMAQIMKPLMTLKGWLYISPVSFSVTGTGQLMSMTVFCSILQEGSFKKA